MLRNLSSRYFKNLTSISKRCFAQTNISSPYVSSLYQHWQKDPSSVGDAWNKFFQTQKPSSVQEISRATYSNADLEKQIELMFKVYSIFRNFYFEGHLLADLDPLFNEQGLPNHREFGKRSGPQQFNLEFYQLSESDLDIPLYFGDVEVRRYIHPFMAEKEEWTAREIYARLNQLYRGKFGIEYIHLIDPQEKLFLEQAIVELALTQPPQKQQVRTFNRLARAHAFNEFLKTKFPTSKRFGIEGNDTLISGLGALVDQCGAEKVENIVFGMAHRGRLSTLANVFHKPLEVIFAEFQNKFDAEEKQWGNSGDVKYHLGTTLRKEYQGHFMNLIMLPNPSHLEFVNPVVSGKTRSIQEINKPDHDVTQSALAIIIHGDASIAGQGIVYEHMQMNNLEGYKVNGQVHIVVNNQVGFTTTPIEGRSGTYCTEVAKAIDAPIIHVNGDDPDLVDAVMKKAVQYRNKFQKDIVIDLIGYRRYGHNEQDQPAFTQPQMYKRIEQMEPVYVKYEKDILQRGTLNQEQINEKLNEVNTALEKAYQNSRRETFDFSNWMTKADDRMIEITKWGLVRDTGVPKEDLQRIGETITTLPNTLEVHPTIKKIYEQRKISIQEGKGIDFATAESLAFGSLIDEGFSIRLSGQDVERGTFSYRHCVLNDQLKDIKYYPLKQLLPDNKKNNFQVYNSPLSESSVLGFEYGYSLSNPNTLTIWEAQFGDFANEAQVIIDNFISSGEAKWNVQSGLVVMLPHGMDGQGPEHSSGRIERFLQLMSDDPEIYKHHGMQRIRKQILESNMQVVVCSNAANYFHILRRQLRREFRKPLVLFNSKRLLKFPRASSDFELFKQSTRFSRVIGEQYSAQLKPPQEIKRVVVCYGQIYYDILDRRNKLQRDDIAIVRIEQLAPFPYDHFKAEIKSYTNAEFIMCQEEHQNSGAWYYLQPRIHSVLQRLREENILKHSHIHYCGRRPSSSTATGSSKVHAIELEKVLEKLFG